MTLVSAGQRVTADVESTNYAISDTSSITVTQATFQALSKNWTVPASDAAVGTCYRVTCWGNGTWGSTVQTLNFQMTFGGAAFGVQPSIGSSQFSASAAFRWDVVMFLQCQFTGTFGLWHGYIRGDASQTANNDLASTGANGSVAFVGGPSSQVTQDSTVDSVLVLQASWASVTGAPTLTSHGSMFERLGG